MKWTDLQQVERQGSCDTQNEEPHEPEADLGLEGIMERAAEASMQVG